MSGEHTPNHIAELVRFIPHDSALGASVDEDAAWDMDRTLLAMILNSLNLLIWGMSDKNKRGAKPEQILPKHLKRKSRKLDAQVMSIDELKAALSLERR